MPIDGSIYNAFAPRVQSVADFQNALAQQQHNALAMQGGQLDLQMKQQGMADQAQVRNALAQGADLSTPEGRIKFQQAAPMGSIPILKGQADLDKVRSDIALATSHGKDFESQAATRGLDAARSLLPMVKTPDQFGQWVDGLYQNPATAKLVTQQFGDPETVKARIPQDPAQFQQFLQQNAMGMDKFIQNQTQTRGQDMTAATAKAEQGVQTRGQDISSATAIRTTGMNNATSLATNASTQAGENTRAGEQRKTQFMLAGMNPDGTSRMAVGADGQIDLKTVSPEDLAAAHRYRADGTFPPNMGRGVQGAAEGRKIRAISSALDAQAGESPEDARYRQLAAKGDIAAINQMRKREIAVGANVKNFDFNADQVLQLSGKVDRSGVPIANAWINAGRRSVTGNPELSAFDVAVKTTVNEFAQIVSGTTAGATTEGEKKKAESLLNSQQTPEQIMSVINQMRVESQNRMKSFADQRRESMPTARGGTRQPDSGAPGAHPPDITDLLKKYGK